MAYSSLRSLVHDMFQYQLRAQFRTLIWQAMTFTRYYLNPHAFAQFFNKHLQYPFLPYHIIFCTPHNSNSDPLPSPTDSQLRDWIPNVIPRH